MAGFGATKPISKTLRFSLFMGQFNQVETKEKS
jgi:hypothetical protein